MQEIPRRKFIYSSLFLLAPFTSILKNKQNNEMVSSTLVISGEKNLIFEDGSKELFENFYPRKAYLDKLMSFAKDEKILERHITRSKNQLTIKSIWKSRKDFDEYTKLTKPEVNTLYTNLKTQGYTIRITVKPHNSFLEDIKALNSFKSPKAILSDIIRVRNIKG